MIDRNDRVQRFNVTMKPVIQKTDLLITDELIYMGFFDAPASTKYHGAYEGGLFDHSLNVTMELLNLTQECCLSWKREESPLIIGMFHDICKVDAYRHPKCGFYTDNVEQVEQLDESKWEHNPNALLKGHGDKSVMLLSKWFTLTTEEILCIRYHMGAFTDKSEWNDYTRAVHTCPNVLWTHHADMLATHVLEE